LYWNLKIFPIVYQYVGVEYKILRMSSLPGVSIVRHERLSLTAAFRKDRLNKCGMRHCGKQKKVRETLQERGAMPE
jgi:hypothetical protein